MKLGTLTSPDEVSVEGSRRETVTQDDDAISLLGGILKELRIMNIHLSILI